MGLSKPPIDLLDRYDPAEKMQTTHKDSHKSGWKLA